MPIIVRLLVSGVLAAGLASQPGHANVQLQHRSEHANFAQESVSQDARHVADWIVHSQDNSKLPFIIVDKKNAKVFVFNAEGLLQGAAPALLGMAYGDNSADGIGQRKLASIRADERTTPAGRFVGSLGENLDGTGILWVDYDAAISLHRVATNSPKQQRTQRLASPTVADNRISFGCINVPPEFYEQIVETTFKDTNGIIYVLPETRSMNATFGSYEVGERGPQSAHRELASIEHETLSNGIIKLR